ncbi:baseplate J/gp47 family protein [candidate division WOR-3 bacterium]|nr:baseplate J/gp47 family protein [candidate division WOR-3 bacterium]
MKYANDIYEVMRNKFLELNQAITNFNIGSRIRSLLESAALAIEEGWFRLDTMYQGLFAATAHETDLDLRALELGTTRRAAKKSVGYVRFYGTPSTVISEDTICSTDVDIEPIVECLTTEAKTIPAAGYVDVPVQAKEAGESGNVEAEKVIYLPQSIGGVTQIKNLYAIAGGAEQEDDELLRKRIVLRWYELAHGDCEEKFRSWALQVEGVAEAHVVSCWQGPGTFKIYVWSKDETGKLIPASETLILDVEDLFEQRNIPCISFSITKPTGVLSDVFVHLTAASGYVFTTVHGNLRNAIISFFNDLDVGDDLIKSQLLAAIMAVAGVEDAKIGNPKNNVACSGSETIMLGRCNVVSDEWETQHVIW